MAPSRRRTRGGAASWSEFFGLSKPASAMPAQVAEAVAPAAAPVNETVTEVTGVAPGGTDVQGKPLLGGRKRKTRRRKSRRSTRKH
jgi:hypothetical protein